MTILVCTFFAFSCRARVRGPYPFGAGPQVTDSLEFRKLQPFFVVGVDSSTEKMYLSSTMGPTLGEAIVEYSIVIYDEN